jgi:homoserine dehydrogenase
MSAPKPSTVNPLLLQRQKIMEANVARLQDLFEQKGHVVGANKQDFAQLAHNLVYGATHKVTTPNNQDTQRKD